MTKTIESTTYTVILKEKARGRASLGRHGYDAFGNQFGGRGGTWGPL